MVVDGNNTVSMILPQEWVLILQYWGRNMRQSHGDGDLVCGTAVVTGLGLY